MNAEQDKYRENLIREREREDELERIRCGMPNMKQVDDFIEQYMLKEASKGDIITDYSRHN